MDKEIIIDGVDVAGCIQFVEDDNCCCDLGGDCKGWDDCYYKQLKRLEQENEQLKEEIEKLKGTNGTIHPDSAYYKITRLEQENAELKAELDTYKRIWNDKEVHIALTDVRTGERKLWYENCLKYKSCLQEIKEIIEKGQWDFAGVTEKQILQIITKAEEE